eukprot:UN30600
MEEDVDSSDILQMKLGNMKPDTTCSVTFSYITELELLQDEKLPKLRFTYPIVLGERYTPAYYRSHISQHVPKKQTEDLPYTWNFDLEVVQPTNVKIEPYGGYKYDTSKDNRIILLKDQHLYKQLGVDIVHEPPLKPTVWFEQGYD